MTQPTHNETRYKMALEAIMKLVSVSSTTYAIAKKALEEDK